MCRSISPVSEQRTPSNFTISMILNCVPAIPTYKKEQETMLAKERGLNSISFSSNALAFMKSYITENMLSVCVLVIMYRLGEMLKMVYHRVQYSDHCCLLYIHHTYIHVLLYGIWSCTHVRP